MKSLLYLSTAIILSAVSIFTQAELNVSFDVPEQVISGESFILDIKVDKGDIENFSKLQLDLPQGFTAELIDGKGATFTFFDQKLKLIWIALPAESQFNVQIKISTEKQLSGNFNFNGKISYVVDGSERKEKKISTPVINIGNTPSPIAQSPAHEEKDVVTVVSNDFACQRILSSSSLKVTDTLLVILKINNSSISGHGKIIEQIPAGLEAIENHNNGAIFSVTDNQIKFLWMTFPAENTFEISYKLVVSSEELGNKIIDGKISFLDGEETKTVLIKESSFKIGKESEEVVAINDNAETLPTMVLSSEEGTYDTDTEVNAVENEKQVETVELSETTTTETNKQNISYRVQICATKKQVNTVYFVNNHNINEKIYADMHEGWHKYTTGQFSVYKQARNHRETIKTTNNIKGPFVTAYSNGNRITVQEALMISNDQWTP